jgi:hypothetical protein
MNKVNGVILYQGPSKFNGKPIIVIANGLITDSQNEKTGNMVQTYILCADQNPVSANYNFKDDAICGYCKHAKHGTCYVTLHEGPYSVYYAYLRGLYPVYNEAEHSELFKDKSVRLGSYGDPAAVGYEIWENILKLTNKFTGYTHAWGNKKIDPRFKNIIMASCDTIKETQKAQSVGWRTFRIRLSKNDVILDNEFICPAGKENENSEMTCSKCLNCKGLSCNSSKNPTIVIHGTDYKIQRFKKLITKINNKKKHSIDVNAYRKAVSEIRKQFTQI